METSSSPGIAGSGTRGRLEQGDAMSDLVTRPPLISRFTTSLIASANEGAQRRFLEFFAATIRNAHTRRAYSRSVGDFLAWCEQTGVTSIAAVQHLHVATWIELQTRERSAPSVKQQLAAIPPLVRLVCDGADRAGEPAASVRAPSHICASGQNIRSRSRRGACPSSIASMSRRPLGYVIER